MMGRRLGEVLCRPTSRTWWSLLLTAAGICFAGMCNAWAGAHANPLTAQPSASSTEIAPGRYRIHVEAQRYQRSVGGQALLARLAFKPGTATLDPKTPALTPLRQGKAEWFVECSPDMKATQVMARVSLFGNGDLTTPVSGRTLRLQTSEYPQTKAPVALEPRQSIADTKTVVFSDSFETGAPGWTTRLESGDVDWMLANQPESLQVLRPTLNPTLVSLPDSGFLPPAHDGSTCFWFGSDRAESRGTFLGGYDPERQSAKNGGTSLSPQTAALISPVIDLTDQTTAVLRFWTWWEAEGVDIADGQYDQMEIWVQDSEHVESLIGTINPLNDVDGEAFKPYSSGGLGQPGTWIEVAVDLTAYVGDQVTILFRFDSEDELYNAFRGWLIDDITVTNNAIPEPVITTILPGVGVNGDIIAISGLNFMVGAEVFLNGIQVTTAVVSSHSVLIEVPGLEPDLYDVMLINPDRQQATSLNGLEILADVPPDILAITPPAGPCQTAVAVTLEGGHFQAGASIRFGGLEADNIVFLGPEMMSCSTPATLLPGFHNVTIINPNGLSDTLFGGYEASGNCGDCDHPGHDFVTIVTLGPASTGDRRKADTGFPLIQATLRVDTEAGLNCELGVADFTVAEDGVEQGLVSATCAADADTGTPETPSLYTITYETSQPAPDGSRRTVRISATDPLEGTDCDEGEYQAPLAETALDVAPTLLSALCRTGTSPADGVFRVRNAGIGSLSFSVTESIDWLSVSPAAGVSNGAWEDVEVIFDTGGLLEGVYTGTITISDGGSTAEVEVILTVADLLARREISDGCYSPGDLVDVSLTLDFGGAGTITHVQPSETLPPGWVYRGVVCDPPPDGVSFDEDTDTLEFSWTDMPPLPVTMVYQVQVSAAAADGVFCFSGATAYSTADGQIYVPIHGQECLEIGGCCPPHDADWNGDWMIDLADELGRMITFYTQNGYHCDVGTQDNYAPGVGIMDCAPHDTDQNGDWRVQLSPELTRIIQFANIGSYHCETGTEDGYAPGLTTLRNSAAKGTLTTARTFSPTRYTSGATVDVTVALSHTAPAAISALALEETLPRGWVFQSIVSNPAPPIVPAVGASGTLGFAWLAVPTTWPLVFTYRVTVPGDAKGIQCFYGDASFRELGPSIPVAIPETDITSNTHNVTFSAGANGSIQGTAAQVIAHGENAEEVTAKAAFGFVFDRWSDDNTDNPRTYGPVLDNADLTAFFRVADPVDPIGPFATMVDADGVALGRGIWDLSGHFETVVDGNPLALDLLHDGKGKILGTGTYTVAGIGAIPLVAKGSGKGKAGVLVVKLGLKGALGASKLSVKMTLTLNAAAAQLEGVTVLKGTIDGAKVAVTDTNTILPMPVSVPAMDGTWNMVFGLAYDGKTITGNAVLGLSNGASFMFIVKGKVKDDVAAISLKGDPSDLAAKSIKVKISIQTLEGEQAVVTAVSAKAYGQAVAW